MIKEIWVFNMGSFDIDMSQLGTTTKMTLSQYGAQLATIKVLSPIVSFDTCIDSLLFDAGINEIWEYC